MREIILIRRYAPVRIRSSDMSGIHPIMRRIGIALRRMRRIFCFMNEILCESSTIMTWHIRNCEYDRIIRFYEASHETFGYKWTNLFWCKVHYSDNLFPEKFFFGVFFCDLCAGMFDSDSLSKINYKLIGWLSCFRKIWNRNDRSNSEFYHFKIIPRDNIHSFLG